MPLTMTAEREAYLFNQSRMLGNEREAELKRELDATRVANQKTQADLDKTNEVYSEIRCALREGLTQKENVENATTLEKIRFTQTKLAETQAIVRELLDAIDPVIKISWRKHDAWIRLGDLVTRIRLGDK